MTFHFARDYIWQTGLWNKAVSNTFSKEFPYLLFWGEKAQTGRGCLEKRVFSFLRTIWLLCKFLYMISNGCYMDNTNVDGIQNYPQISSYNLALFTSSVFR